MLIEKAKTIGFLWLAILVCLGLSKPVQSQLLEEIMNQEFRKLKTPLDYESFVEKYKPNELAFVAVQRLATQYIHNRQWKDAVAVFEKHKPMFPNMENRFAKIIELLEAPEEGLVVRNLGSSINTSAGEWDPTPTPNGRKLYFTGHSRSDGYGKHDVFVSEMLNGRWQPAQNAGKDVNTEAGDETIDNITADGTRLLLSGSGPAELGSFGMFYIDKTTTGWGPAQLFPSPINSRYHDEGPFMTSDGKSLLFSSDRPGGIGDFHEKQKSFHGSGWGNTDIYVCLKTDSGWGDPINLGPVINTPYAETSHFIHPDSKTLYFSSDAHYGLGCLDVFKSTRLSDTSWTEWSEPVNLGKEINSEDDDWGYVVDISGDSAFFAAKNREGGSGGWDIYSITLPRQIRPDTVVTIKGKVTDETGKFLAADIKWENLSTGKNVGQLKTDPQDGSYFIALPLGKIYGYFAEAQGYYPVSENINLKNKTESTSITKDIVLISIQEMKKTDKTILINNLFFDFDKYHLKPESYPELKRLANILKQNPDLHVEILGYTDNVGTPAYNKQLSEKRAKAVVDYIVSIGCDASKLSAGGFGESQPVASNETEKGRCKNRRVEFQIKKD